MAREAETNSKIVNLLAAALAEIKHCKNEQQRNEFHICLGAVMPHQEEECDSKGFLQRICERLNVQHSKRSAKLDMYVCMYVCTYVCMHVCMYALNVYVYIYHMKFNLMI